MVEAMTAPAIEMIRASYVGHGWAFLGGLAWLLVFRWAVPMWARR